MVCGNRWMAADWTITADLIVSDQEANVDELVRIQGQISIIKNLLEAGVTGGWINLVVDRQQFAVAIFVFRSRL